MAAITQEPQPTLGHPADKIHGESAVVSMPPASISPGLELLGQVDRVFLKLKAVPFSFLTPKHRLTVLTSSDQPLYVFDEKNQDGDDCCACGTRTFSIVMKDAQFGRDVLWLEEVQGGCCGDGAGVAVKHGRDGTIGSVLKTGSCGPPAFDILDGNGQPCLSLESEAGCFGGMQFAVRPTWGRGQNKIGSVAHEVSGCCSSTTTLEVCFPSQADTNQKALILAGAVLLLYYAIRGARQQQQHN